MESPRISNRHAPLRLHLNLLSWVLLAFVMQSSARPGVWGLNNSQTSFNNNTFIRSFSNSSANSLPTCMALPLVVQSLNSSTNNTLGKPPYYMITFVVGGTPTTAFIGTHTNNLSYTVTEPPGSQMALSVVDANGSTIATSNVIYTAIDGQTTQCIRATTEFRITANVTDQLSTCQPWRITITGGIPPYTITFLAANFGAINATIPFGDDSFTYINRAEPNTELLSAVSDSTGRWADGTVKVETIGSTDTDCVGLANSSGNSTIIQQQEAAKRASKHRRTITLILSVVLVTGLAIGLSVIGFRYLRTRIIQPHAQFDDSEIIPHSWIDSGRRTCRLSMKKISKYLTSTPSKESSSQQNIMTKIADPVQPDGPPSTPSKELSSQEPIVTRTVTASPVQPDRPPPTPSKEFSSKQPIVTRTVTANSVQPDRPPPTPRKELSSQQPNVPNHTCDQVNHDPEPSRPFSISDYAFFEDTVTLSNPSPSLYFLPTPSFATSPAGEGIEIVNQNKKTSCVEGELTYYEPALSDTGSNILPGSIDSCGELPKRRETATG